MILFAEFAPHVIPSAYDQQILVLKLFFTVSNCCTKTMYLNITVIKSPTRVFNNVKTNLQLVLYQFGGLVCPVCIQHLKYQTYELI